MQTVEVTRKMVRQALNAWDSTPELGDSQLAELPFVEAHRRSQGYTHAATGRGLALREVLQQLIDATRPNEDEPNPEEKPWRAYVILTERFQNGRSLDWIEAQLFVSRRTYHLEQSAALDAVAALITERMERSARLVDPAAETADSGPRTLFLAPPLPAHPIVGRSSVIENLRRNLLADPPGGSIALQGPPGSGKSALALALAHDPAVQEAFPDGVLWVGLGRTPDLEALQVSWAKALGTAGPSADRGRSMARQIYAAIGDRRLLLVIDDAWQTEAALEFKLGGPNCVHLLTTRRSDLALDFAAENLVQIQELDNASGFELLEQLAPDLVAGDPAAARTLVLAAGGLPLALTLIGSHLRKHAYGGQPRRLTAALERLEDTQVRLNVSQPQSPLERRSDMEPGTPWSVAAAIEISESELSQAAQQAWRDLSVFPPKPSSFSEEAALSISAARVSALDELVDQALVEAVGVGRYSLHQTIHDYAQMTGPSQDARERFTRFFLDFGLEYADHHDFLDRELSNLQAALGDVSSAHPELLISAALALHPYLDRRGLYALDAGLLESAFRIAETRDAWDEMARLLHARGVIQLHRGDHPGAQEQFEQSLEIARSEDLADLTPETMRLLGVVHIRLANYGKAERYLQEAAAAFEAEGDDQGQANVLNSWGNLALRAGNFEMARRQLEKALNLVQGSDFLGARSRILNGLGIVSRHSGDYSAAVDYYQQAIAISRELGDRGGEAMMLDNLGVAAMDQDENQAAVSYLEQSLAIHRETGNRYGEGISLQNMAEVLIAMGQYDRAWERNMRSRDICIETGDREGEGYASQNAGVIYADTGDLAQARAEFEFSLQVRIEQGETKRVGQSQYYLGLVLLLLGEREAAVELAGQALATARDVQDRRGEADAIVLLGRAVIDESAAGKQAIERAISQLELAIRLRKEHNEALLALDAQSWLMRALDRSGSTDQADALLEQVIAGLEGPLSTLARLSSFLNARRALDKRGDPRASELLKRAELLRRGRADRIEDAKMRAGYLSSPINAI
jgi:tetratricopeptide (TPR) repeat protein